MARLLDAADNVIVARVTTARTPVERMRGLLGRAGFPAGEGLCLSPCSAIHTFGMAFAIDVLFVDRGWRVIRFRAGIGPCRVVWGGWRAHAVVEVASGWLAAERLPRGTQLRLA